ncbi:hypothetical protein RFI_37371, partial [Reticulomyxa filosa]
WLLGEKTLLKEIHFGSDGGIIGLIVEQQLVNNGSVESNGGNGYEHNGKSNGDGSGGPILIEFQSQDQFSSQLNTNISKQIFGIITCIGGNKYQKNKGRKDRIAIYSTELSSDIKET